MVEARKRILLVAAVTLLTATLLAYRPQHAGIWWQTLFEWMHVPVFALIAAALFALTPPGWGPWPRSGTALFAAASLALATEAVQFFLGRNASVIDLVADAIGASAVLLVAATRQMRPAAAALGVAVAVGLITYSLVPVVSITKLVVARETMFPVLFDGNVEAAGPFMRRQNVAADTRWSHERGRIYARVQFSNGAWPGLEFREPVADWSGFQRLVFDLYLESQTPLQLTVRVHDKEHLLGEQPYGDRFNQHFGIKPGPTTLSIPIEDIEAGPRNRRIDLEQVAGFMLFTTSRNDRQVLRVYEIRLE